MSAPAIFDSHCHLGWDSLAASLGPVLARAAAAGVVGIVDVGIDVASSQAALARAGSHPGLFPTAGLHPNDCAAYERDFPTVAELGRRAEVVALGETGLDLYRDRVPLAIQLASLEQHLALAREVGKPVILHCRDAFTELLDALTGWRGIRGVLHCFTGTLADARRCLDLGLHVSFAGPVTYPRNEELRRAAAFVPGDRLLVETDAPFLPPQSHRGQGNEPALLRETVQGVAAVRGIGVEQLAELTANNARHFFGIADDGRSRLAVS